ncbi:unnamed protein product [Somion occarium]|uniref:Uncharacterized protein n=1 Tax=Somion occarium TaxID=3059160 RepID=A0ABP1D990_9APHY
MAEFDDLPPEVLYNIVARIATQYIDHYVISPPPLRVKSVYQYDQWGPDIPYDEPNLLVPLLLVSHQMMDVTWMVICDALDRRRPYGISPYINPWRRLQYLRNLYQYARQGREEDMQTYEILIGIPDIPYIANHGSSIVTSTWLNRNFGSIKMASSSWNMFLRTTIRIYSVPCKRCLIISYKIVHRAMRCCARVEELVKPRSPLRLRSATKRQYEEAKKEMMINFATISACFPMKKGVLWGPEPSNLQADVLHIVIQKVMSNQTLMKEVKLRDPSDHSRMRDLLEILLENGLPVMREVREYMTAQLMKTAPEAREFLKNLE